jgi:hypothetical protein
LRSELPLLVIMVYLPRIQILVGQSWAGTTLKGWPLGLSGRGSPMRRTPVRYMPVRKAYRERHSHKRYAPAKDACPRDACPRDACLRETHAYEGPVLRFPTPDAPMKSPETGPPEASQAPFRTRNWPPACLFLGHPPHAVGTNLFRNGS